MGDPTLTYDRQAISVDCVIFGFDGDALKVLLIRRCKRVVDGSEKVDMKLPGSLIADNESLESAASRVMNELTGINNICLRQLEVFSDPQRVVDEELEWINDYYGVHISRVVTVIFYALVRLDNRLMGYTTRKNALWIELNEVKHLALDHNNILISAIDFLMCRFQEEPMAYELLPRKFTIRMLQTLYEAVFGVELDNRNFRKKMLTQSYIVPMGEKERGVAHKPAQYYRFDRKIYEKENKCTSRLNFIGR